MGLLISEAYDSGASGFVGSVAIYGGIGYLLDAAQTHREAVYRGPVTAPALGAKLSFRF
jgi:hypothetical protein